ncbi:MAG TPA: hypothetical protein VL988_12710, partial [Solirubrobacteraceae bacterium]|nr:hypothetical protein [Solirubrobacteraceae bacterium]
IPNIFQLWSVLHTSTLAQLTWGLAKICQSMLAEPTSESAAAKTRRANVQKRNEEFNATLAEVCGEFIHCQYDKGAAYAIKFESKDVGTVDYFHPNTSGQAKAAANAWTNGPNFADLSTPTTTISADHEPEGGEGWYRSNVQLTLSAGDAEFAVAGTEYKLNGQEGWTKYTGPITVSADGETTITARSVDVNGNIEQSTSKTIKVDKTGPAFTLTCPAEPVALGSAASAVVSGASDAASGLASDPNGERSLDTSTPGDGQSYSVQLEDIAGNTTSHTCNYDVHYPDPGAPALSSGTSPNQGLFSLAWTGTDPAEFGILYTLAHKNAAQEEFSDVATGLSSLEYAFTGAGEEEGTWVYRVQGNDPSANLTTGWSGESAPVVVDKTAPNPPSASADRAPDYAGDGGWYADSVTVSFADNGDPALADGSPGSGVDPGSVPASQTFTTDGPHEASGSVADYAGNQSAEGGLTVKVDASAPKIGIECPSFVPVGAKGVTASVLAADAQSGLASDPSGTVPIDTNSYGPQTVERTAVDNVGHSSSASCTTQVGFTQVVSGSSKHKLVVKAGESVQVTASAVVKAIQVEPGGALDVEGASVGGIKSSGASVIRVCGATLKGASKISGSTGPVTIGDGKGCAPNTFGSGATLIGNTGGVTVVGNSIHAKLTVKGGSGGTVVTNNTIGKALTVTGNSGEVVDTPNTVSGKSKVQAHRS